MVVRFGSDVDVSRVRRVELDVGWNDTGATPFATRTFSFVERLSDGGTRGFPGSVVIAPPDAIAASDGGTGRVLKVEARIISANAGGGERTYVTTRALARFARERTLTLDLYFSDLCGASGVSDRCLANETCQVAGSTARCVPVEIQETLANYTPDAAPPLPPLPMDAAVVLPDVTVPDATVLDASVPAGPPPRWFPWHGARMSSGNVTFRWDPSQFSGTTTLQICAERTCASPMMQMPGTGSATVTLPRGAYFWRVSDSGAMTQRPARLVTILRNAMGPARVLGTGLHYSDTRLADLVIGAPGGEGAIWYASNPRLWVSIPRPVGSPMGFGGSLANAGDLDGDGMSEVVVGTPSELIPAPAESVFVYGRAGATFGALKASLTFPMNTRAGYALATGGDLDGDGQADLLVGAPAENAGRGVVLRYNGWGTNPTPAPTLTSSDDGVMGVQNYGTALAGGCDFDGDGYGDYVVGAVTRNLMALPGGDTPYVQVMFGGPTRAFAPFSILATPAFQPVRFGAALACGGDINGDGFGDLLVGDPRARVGAVAVGAVVAYSLVGRVPVALNTWLGTTVDGEFGAAVAFLPEPTIGDDVLIGVPGDNVVKGYYGGTFVYSGNAFPTGGSPGIGRVIATGGFQLSPSEPASLAWLGAGAGGTAGQAFTASWTKVFDTMLGRLFATGNTNPTSPIPMSPVAGSRFGAAIAN
jgi:hypothetical protein